MQFPDKFLAICQYDETRFANHLISEMIQIHPKVIARGKVIEHPFHRHPATAASVSERPIKVDELVAA
ncbi:hypothetical protein D3C83_155390 [compost metagenome]